MRESKAPHAHSTGFAPADVVSVPFSLPTVQPPPLPDQPLRRVVDIVGSAVLLVLLAPLMLVIGVMIKATSSGPVFYRQTRVGVNRRSGRDRRGARAGRDGSDRRRMDRRTIASAGKQFLILKFRTMIEDAEAATGPQWAAKSDARITPLGGFLRRYRFDELPQLVNVFRGEMTFIGPRPERPFFVERFRRRIPDYADRLRVLPGITGLAQVEHKYDESEEDVRRKLEYDLRYVRGRGFGTDLRILWKTVIVVLTGAGAH